MEPGTVVKVEKLDAEVGSEVTFEALMASDGKTVQIGDPVLAELVVKGKVLAQDKAKKVIVFKYKPKKDYRKKQGHRQPYTKIEIVQVGTETAKAKPAAAKKDSAAKTAEKSAAEKKPAEMCIRDSSRSCAAVRAAAAFVRRGSPCARCANAGRKQYARQRAV